MALKHHSSSGFSLTELLCVMAIIGVLAGLYLGAIAKAFVHSKNFLDHLFGH
jgi:prepilin-type N-terminal cleavage/methylation domain-containing protein